VVRRGTGAARLATFSLPDATPPSLAAARVPPCCWAPGILWFGWFVSMRARLCRPAHLRRLCTGQHSAGVRALLCLAGMRHRVGGLPSRKPVRVSLPPVRLPPSPRSCAHAELGYVSNRGLARSSLSGLPGRLAPATHGAVHLEYNLPLRPNSRRRCRRPHGRRPRVGRCSPVFFELASHVNAGAGEPGCGDQFVRQAVLAVRIGIWLPVRHDLDHLVVTDRNCGLR